MSIAWIVRPLPVIAQASFQDQVQAGAALAARGDDARAVATWEAALSRLRAKNDLRAIADGLRQVINASYSIQGSALRTDVIVRYLREAEAGYRAVGDDQQRIATLSDLGTNLSGIGRYADAIAPLVEVVSYRRAQHDPNLVLALELLGKVQMLARHTSDAIVAYQEAAALRVQLHDAAPTGPLAGIHAVSNVSDRLTLAGLELDLGRYDESIAAAQEAYSAATAIGNAGLAANAQSSVATALSTIGRYAEALDFDRRALESYKAVRADPKNPGLVMQTHDNLGAAHQSMAVILTQLKSYTEALAQTQASLVENQIAGYPVGAAFALRQMAEVERATGHAAVSRVLDARAQAVFDAFHWSGQSAVTAVDIAVTANATGDYSDALTSAGKAIAWARGSDAPTQILWTGLYAQALAQQKLGQRDAAVASYDEALGAIESLRSNLLKGQQGDYLQSTVYVYDDYIAYLESLDAEYPGQGWDRRAFDVLERKAARTLLEEIASSAAGRSRLVPESIATQEATLEAAVESAAHRLVAEPDQRAHDSAAPAALASALAAQHAFDQGLQSNYPAYFTLLHPAPTKLTSFQQHVLRHDEVVLEYDTAGTDAYVFVIAPERLVLVPLGPTRTLAAQAAALRAHISLIVQAVAARAGQSRLEDLAERDLPAFITASHALFTTVLPASIAQLIADKRLVVVPGGVLFDVPFETLVTGAGSAPAYLLQEHPLSYSPSASLLALVRTSERSHAVKKPLLAFADPAYGGAGDVADVQRGVRVAQLQYHALRDAAGGSFPQLPGSLAEAEGVRTALHSDAQSVVSGEAATKARVLELNDRKELRDYRYVLFATHAVLPNEVSGVQQPALVLAHPERDGFLTMGDVLGLSLDADFVALSACNTGAGAAASGEGVSGMTRAFIYAGTPAISVTLWDVDDRAAPQMTPAFFAAMAAGMTPADALRHAKLMLLASPSALLRHPYAWGPAVIFGDGDRGAG